MLKVILSVIVDAVVILIIVAILFFVVVTFYNAFLVTSVSAGELDLDSGLKFQGQVRSGPLNRETNVTTYRNDDSTSESVNVTHGGAVTHADVPPGREAHVITFPGRADMQPIIVISPSGSNATGAR